MESDKQQNPAETGPLDELRDQTLLVVKQYLDGDESCAEEIVRRMSGRVLGMILMRMGPDLRAKVDPEDLLQEVWLEAFRSLHTFDVSRGTPFGAWLATIVRRMISRALRGGNPTPLLAKHGSGSTERTVTTLLRGSLEQSTPSMKFSRAESVQRLVDAVGDLPTEHQDVVSGYWFEECNAAEIADRMGKSRGAVYMILMRANRVLAGVIKESGVSDPAAWW